MKLLVGSAISLVGLLGCAISTLPEAKSTILGMALDSPPSIALCTRDQVIEGPVQSACLNPTSDISDAGFQNFDLYLPNDRPPFLKGRPFVFMEGGKVIGIFIKTGGVARREEILSFIEKSLSVTKPVREWPLLYREGNRASGAKWDLSSGSTVQMILYLDKDEGQVDVISANMPMSIE